MGGALRRREKSCPLFGSRWFVDGGADKEEEVNKRGISIDLPDLPSLFQFFEATTVSTMNGIL